MGGTGGASGTFPATTAASHSASDMPNFFTGPELPEPLSILDLINVTTRGRLVLIEGSTTGKNFTDGSDFRSNLSAPTIAEEELGIAIEAIENRRSGKTKFYAPLRMKCSSRRG